MATIEEQKIYREALEIAHRTLRAAAPPENEVNERAFEMVEQNVHIVSDALTSGKISLKEMLVLFPTTDTADPAEVIAIAAYLTLIGSKMKIEGEES